MKSQGDTTKSVMVKNLSFKFRTRNEPTLQEISFNVSRGETLGVVGESGCGKSTLLRVLIGLLTPTTGTVILSGDQRDLARSRAGRTEKLAVQLVHQDPFASLNPRMSIRHILEAPLKVNHLDCSMSRISEILDMVGLSTSVLRERPAQLSGGQRQRVAIARAISLQPEVLLLDEPVSALDVSVQAQVINLLTDLQQRLGFACVFVSHDLAVVAHVAHRIAVMYLGRFVEVGDTGAVLAEPAHPYTSALARAVPSLSGAGIKKEAQIQVVGEISNDQREVGCNFRDRCWAATEKCAELSPSLDEIRHEWLVACHHPLNR